MDNLRRWQDRLGRAGRGTRGGPAARRQVLEQTGSEPGGTDNETLPLFVPPGHFYSPITDPTETLAHFGRMAEAGIPEQLTGIDIDHSAMVDLWRQLAGYMRSSPFEAKPTADLRYGYVNEMYDRGDGLVLHSILRHFRPARLIEIGCGWSSACSLDTVERYLDAATDFTFVEPYPELLRKFAAEPKASVRILESRLQDAPVELVDELRADDILFIDSTHVMKSGSDVCWYMFELLPRLAPGVLVHVHDMFWPFEYPRHWAIEQNRAWNEVHAVRAFLANNREWEIVLFNDYFARFGKDVIEETVPEFFENPGGALWLRKR